MNQTIIQCVGIDISKSSFSACICTRHQSGEELLSEVVDFKNQKTGFNQLVKWSRKITDAEADVVFVMEATGVYYESLAHHLHKLKQSVCVVLPNKVNHFAKSLNIKTKTDKVDARIIARMGAERKLLLWTPPHPVYKKLRDLTRGYKELMSERTTFKNRLQALRSSHEPLPILIQSHKSLIKKLNEQIERFKTEIKSIIDSEPWLAEKVDKITTINGVGYMTVVVILAETQGFEFVQNNRQLCSYAGYDVVQKESGTSISGKTRISKKGNSWIRGALHFPAIVAAKKNPAFMKVYQRINERNKYKMIAMTAIQRKILVLIYTLWKNDTVFDEDYEKKKSRFDRERKKAGSGTNQLPAQDETRCENLEISFV